MCVRYACNAELGKEKKGRRRVCDISVPRSFAGSCLAQKSLATSGAHAENVTLLSVRIRFETWLGKWHELGATLAATVPPSAPTMLSTHPR